MFRDLALKSSQRISCDPKIVPAFVAGHDIDSDHIEELVIFGELGEIVVYKNDSVYSSSALASPLPLCNFNIFLFNRQPTIILLSIDGSMTMTECNNLMPNHSIDFSHITRLQTGLWNCSCIKPFMCKSNCYVALSADSTVAIFRYDSVGKTSQLQLQFKLAGPIHSLGALSSRFLISGSQSGKIDVVSLWKETSPNEGNETFEATSVPARPGFLPPLPNARSSFSSIGPASIIRGLSRYHPTNQSLCMFAAGWVDGRICIFNILRIPEGTATPSASKSPLPPNSCWEWSVVQSFHTRYSLFRLDYVRLKSPYQVASLLPCNSTADDLSSQDQQQGQGQGQGQDLDSNWQSVHGDLEDEEVNYQQAREEGYLIASSHTGHTVIINLLSSDFGESSATSGEDQRSRRLFSFDSRHALHGEVVRYTAIGRLSHVRPQPTQPAAVSASSPQPSSLSLVYLTGRGDIWIVSDIEVELSLLGPPTIPSLCFSSAEIEKANRVVRMWNIIKPIPSPQPLHPTHRSTSSDTERSISSCNPASVSVSVSQPHHHDGVDLIRRLLSTSLADLQQMADLTSLEAWGATASPVQGQESGESEKGEVKGMPQDQQEECALSPADLSCSSAAPSPPL